MAVGDDDDGEFVCACVWLISSVGECWQTDKGLSAYGFRTKNQLRFQALSP